MANTNFKIDNGLLVTGGESLFQANATVNAHVIVKESLTVDKDLTVTGNLTYSNTSIDGNLIPTANGKALGNTTRTFTVFADNLSLSNSIIAANGTNINIRAGSGIIANATGLIVNASSISNGILNIGQGGTNASTRDAGLNNLLPTQNTAVNGYFLKTNGTNASWIDGIGAQGPQGFTGSQGIIGFTGPQGVIGFTGSQGIIGAQGPQGYTGSSGINGVTVQGPIGFTGSKGAQGPQGFTGSQGPQGYTGSQGAQGPQGFTGSQGAQGYTGSQGAQGPQGYTGSQGAQGPQGYTGSQGATGAQGPQGYTGSQGINGNTVQGPQGYTGSQGINGNTVQGPQGYTGSQGINGNTVQGPQGYTGSQGINGNTVQGPQGFTGSQGNTVQGPQGFTGSAGPVAGSSTFVQFNDSGVANGVSTFTFTKSTNFLYVGGDIQASDFVVASDDTLKDVIGNIPNALDIINSLDGIRYTWNELGQQLLGYKGDKIEIGVLAQQIEKELPELIAMSNDGDYKMVAYARLTAVLIEAVKELSVKVDALENQ